MLCYAMQAMLLVLTLVWAAISWKVGGIAEEEQRAQESADAKQQSRAAPTRLL